MVLERVRRWQGNNLINLPSYGNIARAVPSEVRQAQNNINKKIQVLFKTTNDYDYYKHVYNR